MGVSFALLIPARVEARKNHDREALNQPVPGSSAGAPPFFPWVTARSEFTRSVGTIGTSARSPQPIEPRRGIAEDQPRVRLGGGLDHRAKRAGGIAERPLPVRIILRP